MRIAFLGLGVMGGPMAGHLHAKGHQLRAWTRSDERRRDWEHRYGCEAAATAALAVADCELVLLCLGNDASVREVLVDQGVLEAMAPGAVLVDHTTASAELAQELAATCRQHNLGFVDAPVSGGQAGAEQGLLTVMAGGESADFEQALPAMECYARKVTLLGPAGAGQTAKMVNQICLAGTIQGLAEALHFAEKSALDPAQVVSVISQGAAQSWQMDHRHQTMLSDEYEHGFAVDWMRKDLGIALQEASRLGVALPVTALVDQFYAEVQAMGGGRWDTSSLLRRLRALGCGQGEG